MYLLIPSRSPISLKAKEVMSLEEQRCTCSVEITELPALKCLIPATSGDLWHGVTAREKS